MNLPRIHLDFDTIDEIGVSEEEHMKRLMQLIGEARKKWKVVAINCAAVRR